jgi:hypothetical protein
MTHRMSWVAYGLAAIASLAIGLTVALSTQLAWILLIAGGLSLIIVPPPLWGNLLTKTTSSRVVPVDARLSALQQYGAYALALYLLATTRWGSGISLTGGPPYISDLALLVLLTRHFLAGSLRSVHTRASDALDPWTRTLTLALILLILVHLISGSISQNALRDAAPYFYVIVILLVPLSTAQTRYTVSRALTCALVLHALWVTCDLLDPSLPGSLPVGATGVHILALRPDIDTLVCGLLSALSLHRLLTERHMLINFVFTIWGGALVLALYDRAGLVAFVVQLTMVLMLAPARRRIVYARSNLPLIVVITTTIGLGFVVAASQSTPVQRVIETIEGSSATTNIRGALGTARARSRSWSTLTRYLEAKPIRDIGGVGFGPDFLRESGAEELLLGTGATKEEVRSPHNYLLNTWARLGLIGLAIVVALLCSGVRLAYIVARHGHDIGDVDVLAILVVGSIPVIAFVGVVLESPFGAIPYFWAVGHLAIRCRQGTAVQSLDRKQRLGLSKHAVRRHSAGHVNRTSA